MCEAVVGKRYPQRPRLDHRVVEVRRSNTPARQSAHLRLLMPAFDGMAAERLPDISFRNWRACYKLTYF
jgi:hypothetical protein